MGFWKNPPMGQALHLDRGSSLRWPGGSSWLKVQEDRFNLWKLHASMIIYIFYAGWVLFSSSSRLEQFHGSASGRIWVFQKHVKES